jgi:hypothetical protein
VLSNFEDASHSSEVWQLCRAIRNERGRAAQTGADGDDGMSATARHIAAQFDASGFAVLDELVPLRYERPPPGLPPHVRAASALRLFANRLVIVQDDVNALAVRGDDDGVRAVLLPPSASGERVFDDTLRNKADKLDLEACVTLPNGRFVAFGSGSTPKREKLVVWAMDAPPIVIAATGFYRDVRAAVTRGEARLNLEGAVVRDARIELFHRGNDVRGSSANAIVELSCDAFERWVAGGPRSPRVGRVTTVELGDELGVPYGFTDAVAIDEQHVVVLVCAEDSACAISDGAVLGCRVGMLVDDTLTLVDVHDARGARSLLKLEGIERRAGSSTQFDVAVDVDRPSVPAMLGRLRWEWC